MRSNIRSGVILAGLAITLVVTAEAQSSAKAKIPFNFQIGDRTLAAGVYTINADALANVPDILVFRDVRGKAKAIVNGIRIEAIENPGPSRLVFTKYGDHYFLSQIWLNDQESGTGVPKSKHERELAMKTDLGSQEITLALAR